MFKIFQDFAASIRCLHYRQVLAQSWIGLDGIWIHISLNLIMCLRRSQDTNGVPSDIYLYFTTYYLYDSRFAFLALRPLQFLYILFFDT